MSSKQIISDYIKNGGIDIYCDLIIPKKVEVEVVYENDFIIVIKHTNPLAEYHFVIAPKKHILDINQPEFNEIYLEVLKGINKALSLIPYQKVGAKIEINLGKSQKSKHFHIHVMGGKPLTKAHDYLQKYYRALKERVA